MIDTLNSMQYNNMTPIQEKGLPLILEGKDLIAKAKTGSGKTISFGLGVLNNLNVNEFKIQALVLLPTRELAQQVAKIFSHKGKKLVRLITHIK